MDRYSYSVIIPCRNITDLLERALASIPRREDVQIIVVDDSSDPQKVDFAHYPGLDDHSVEVVFTKEGRGAGFARNVGVERAEGRWLIFLDCDDFFLDGAFDAFDRHADDAADIVYFSVSSVMSEGLSPSMRHKSRSVPLKTLEGRKLEHFCRYEYTEPWGKMIRRSLVTGHGIRFDETPLANDYMFSAQTGHYAAKVAVDTSDVYCVTERAGSLCNQFCATSQQLSVRLDVYSRVQDFFKRNGISLRPVDKLAVSVVLNSPGLQPQLECFYKEQGLSILWFRIKALYWKFRHFVRHILGLC